MSTAPSRPRSDRGGSASDPSELHSGGRCERVGGGKVGLNTPAWNISSGFVSMHAVLIFYPTRAHARTRADPTLELPR